MTQEELVARAEAIATTLVKRQAETEERTYYAEDTHEEFTRAGFYRILVPRRYGGFELGLDAFLRVVTALARGCPSTAWMFSFGTAHALVAATLFSERAQAEMFGFGDFICPATVAPSGTATRGPDGGWVINGIHGYCSGAPYATHFIGHALAAPADGGPPEPLMFVIPRDQWRRLDDWGQQLGLRGSGSHSIAIDDAHIPEYFALPGTHMSLVTVTEGTPGRALHGNPLYGGGPLSSMLFQLAALSIGMAQGAVDGYADLMWARNTIFPPITTRAEDPGYQSRYGDAVGMIATAEAALRDAVAQWTDTCARGPGAFTREQDVRLAMITREVVRLCWHAVEGQLLPTAGSSSVRHGERIERVWRDMSMLHSHAGLAIYLGMLASREFARLSLDVRG